MTAWFRLARDALRFRRAAWRIDIAILARAIGDWFHLSRKALRFQRAAWRLTLVMVREPRAAPAPPALNEAGP